MIPSRRCVRYGLVSSCCEGVGGFPVVSLFATLIVCLQELETGVVDLLIPSPNATAEVGYNRDR